MFGTAAMQRGRAEQLPFMMSRNNSAVVAVSTVTSLSSGGGGITAVFQSEMTSAVDGDPSDATSNAPPAAARRDSVIWSSLYSHGREQRDLAQRIEQWRRSGYSAVRSHPFCLWRLNPTDVIARASGRSSTHRPLILCRSVPFHRAVITGCSAFAEWFAGPQIGRASC